MKLFLDSEINSERAAKISNYYLSLRATLQSGAISRYPLQSFYF